MTTTTAAERIYICKRCRKPKRYEEMRPRYNRPCGVRSECIECDRIRCKQQNQRRKVDGYNPDSGTARYSTMDPCPACGVSQALHWKCRICDCRGHILRRSTAQPDICADCEQNIINGRLSKAA